MEVLNAVRLGNVEAIEQNMSELFRTRVSPLHETENNNTPRSPTTLASKK